jgi:hypothetical protein
MRWGSAVCAALAIAGSADATNVFDGVYEGTRTARFNSPACPVGSGQFTWTVQNDQVPVMNTGADAKYGFAVPINPDGSFEGHSINYPIVGAGFTLQARVMVSGRIADKTFTAHMNTPSCHFDYVLHYIGPVQ